jgi:hypothetical protein
MTIGIYLELRGLKKLLTIWKEIFRPGLLQVLNHLEK